MEARKRVAVVLESCSGVASRSTWQPPFDARITAECIATDLQRTVEWSFDFRCEVCGDGAVVGKVTQPAPIGQTEFTVSGARCDSCSATYTVQLTQEQL